MAEVSPLVLQRLSEAHHYAFTRVQEAAIAAVTSAWLTLGSVRDEDEWLAQFWSIVQSSARVSAYEAAVYLQTQLDYTGIAPRLPRPDLGWLREDFDSWAVTPLREVVRRLATERDVPYEVIVRETVPMVRKLTDTALRRAEINTVDQLTSSPQFAAAFTFEVTRPDQQFRLTTVEEVRALAGQLNAKDSDRRYMRVTQSGACGWCQVVAGKLYSHAASLRAEGWHDRCRCTWREVTSDEVSSWESPLRGQNVQEVLKIRAEPGEQETP